MQPVPSQICHELAFDSSNSRHSMCNNTCMYVTSWFRKARLGTWLSVICLPWYLSNTALKEYWFAMNQEKMQQLIKTKTWFRNAIVPWKLWFMHHRRSPICHMWSCRCGAFMVQLRFYLLINRTSTLPGMCLLGVSLHLRGQCLALKGWTLSLESANTVVLEALFPVCNLCKNKNTTQRSEQATQQTNKQTLKGIDVLT